jgi:hypothetical protein
MDTIQRIAPLLRRGWWATSIDLTDAYFNIPIDPSFRHLFLFNYNEECFQFQAMPFGLATAPEIFTTVALEAASYVKRALDVDVFVYLDDWLLVHKSEAYLRKATHETLLILQDLGFLVNRQKSSLDPSQEIVHLGTVLDFREGFIRPTQERVDKLVSCAQEIS